MFSELGPRSHLRHVSRPRLRWVLIGQWTAVAGVALREQDLSARFKLSFIGTWPVALCPNDIRGRCGGWKSQRTTRCEDRDQTARRQANHDRSVAEGLTRRDSAASRFKSSCLPPPKLQAPFQIEIEPLRNSLGRSITLMQTGRPARAVALAAARVSSILAELLSTMPTAPYPSATL